MVASQKSVATARLRIERVQGGVALACRKATALIVLSLAYQPEEPSIIGEASEVGLTQILHLLGQSSL